MTIDDGPWTGLSRGWWLEFDEPESWLRPLEMDYALLDSLEQPPAWMDRVDDHGDDISGRPRLCISRAVRSEDFVPEHTLIEYVRAAHVLGAAAARLSVTGNGWALGQPFWFLVRQTTELALKLALESETGLSFDSTHHVKKLLGQLGHHSPDHPILAIDGITEFARTMSREDMQSDGGRFPVADGRPALHNVCCVDPAAALWYLRRLAVALKLEGLGRV